MKSGRQWLTALVATIATDFGCNPVIIPPQSSQNLTAIVAASAAATGARILAEFQLRSNRNLTAIRSDSGSNQTAIGFRPQYGDAEHQRVLNQREQSHLQSRPILAVVRPKFDRTPSLTGLRSDFDRIAAAIAIYSGRNSARIRLRSSRTLGLAELGWILTGSRPESNRIAD